MRLNERVLVFQDNQDNPVAIRNRRTPQVGDRVVVHELEDGSLITHGKDQFRVGDRVLVFDDHDDPLMIRIGAEQPTPSLYDWLDGTFDPWEQTGGSNQSYTDVSNSFWGHYSFFAYCYGNYPATTAETWSEGAYGTWTIKYALSGGDYHNPESLNWPYRNMTLSIIRFVHDGVNSYNFRINTDAETIGLYYNDMLLSECYFIRSVDVEHTLQITRDWNGYFSVSIDGVEYLTAIHTSLTASIKLETYFVSYAWGRGLYIDYIQFDELV